MFLAPADLGEAVLATGALAHVVGEGDALTIVCTPEARDIFRAAPRLAQLYAIPDGVAAWRVSMQLARTRYDIVIDARGGFLGRALPSARRIALQPAPIVRHFSETWAAACGVERALGPKLWLDEQARSAATSIAEDGAPLLVLAPGGAARAKRWPAERYAAVARRLATGPLAHARIVALGVGGRDGAITRAVVSSLEADGVSAVDLGVTGDVLAAAALSERATLCLGNDNVLTHLAAAAGAPTLTLFGPTDERVRAPFGPRARTLRGRPFEDVAALSPLDADAVMADVSIDAVEAAALDLLHAGGLR
ncbi:MAG: glycosyltransferase family 9 protein [Hyphomonadaceae bacterium]